jgi:Trypsin-like peptidase domain
LHKSCFTPDNIEVTLYKTENGQHQSHQSRITLLDEHECPIWLQHPTKGQDVDVAIVRFLSLGELQPLFAVREEDVDNHLLVRVGDDAFVLGYPLGLTMQMSLPVWKRASIATEPTLDISIGEVILVDTATREGMSGSPVIAVARGTYTASDGNVHVGDALKLLGIYSGRYGANDAFGAQLGLCWKATIINFLLQNGVPGTYELRKPQS